MLRFEKLIILAAPMLDVLHHLGIMYGVAVSPA